MNENLKSVITLPEGTLPDTYYVYGSTPENETARWYEFMDDGETGAEIDGNVITLFLADALRGDNVLTQDGLIMALDGPVFL